ncbi:hypothetical protein ACFL1E_07905 [Candidatus Omnitrophota bacterium]
MRRSRLLKKFNHTGQALRRSSGQAAAELAVLGSLILVVFSSIISFGQQLEAQQVIKQEAFRKALQKSFQRNAGVSYTVKKDHKFYNPMLVFGDGQPSTLSASATVMWQKGVAGCQHGEDNCDNEKEDNDSSTAQSSFAYYEINNQLIGVPDNDTARIGATPADVTIPRYAKKAIGVTDEEYWTKVPASVWRDRVLEKETHLRSTILKRENVDGDPSKIVNEENISLAENIESEVHLRRDQNTTDANADVHKPNYIDTEIIGGIKQGAYYNEDTNRIEYSQGTVNVPGDENQRLRLQRKWTTRMQP